MATHGKKYQSMKQLSFGHSEIISPEKAFDRLKEISYAQFDESIDIDVNLGIDPTKGEQVVRGSVSLPHVVGQSPRVIVFAKGDHAEQAERAGADYVGAEDLVKKIEDGWLEFDAAVATPDMMALVSRLAKTLGPKGLLPNKKLGTITFDVEQIVAELKKGKTFFRNDKGGIVHFRIGKKSFGNDMLLENLHVFLRALSQAKPAAAKGKYIKKVTVTSTMGPGIQVDPEQQAR